MKTSTQKRMIRHICETTFNLLYEQHYDEITVQRICQEADINRSTFYRYFEDKYDLLYELTSYMSNELFIDSKKTSDFQSVFESFIHYINEHQKVFRHLLVSSRQEDVFRGLTQVGSKMMLEGAYNNNPDLLSIKIRESKYPDIIADFYSSGFVEVLRRWVENNYDYTVEEIFEAINESFDITLSNSQCIVNKEKPE